MGGVVPPEVEMEEQREPEMVAEVVLRDLIVPLRVADLGYQKIRKYLRSPLKFR